jgi:hypothetical protein
MGVEDALACTLASIKDRSVTRKTFGFSQLSSYKEDSRESLGMLLCQFINVFAMRSGNDQDMSRGLWHKISKGYDLLVVMEKFSGDLATRNLAEDTHDEMLALLPMSHQGLNSGESSEASMC